MDVRCENCKSEYDFDENRIPEEGLAVKCSHCAHVFKVQRPSKPERSGEWMVRQTSGAVFSFRELTTLQRWIVERKVMRDDEISKTGKQWKRLGDIAELATFFQVVDAQLQAHAAPQPATAPVAAYPGAYPAPAAYAVQPQVVPIVQPPAVMPAVVPGSMPMPGAQPGMAAPVYPPAGGWDQSAAWGKQSAWQPGQRPSEPVYDEPRRSKRWGVALVVTLLVLGGGVAGTYLFMPQLYRSLLGRPNELAINLVQSAYAQLDRDTYKAIDSALEQFQKASEIDDSYAEARAGLAEAALARAEYLREEADDLSPHLGDVPEEQRAKATADVEERRREASKLSDEAFNAAKEGLRLAPESVAANRAMADYYRFKKAPEQMKPLIDKARTAGPLDSRVSYVLGLAVAPDPAAAERAIRYFDETLERNPAMQRARYMLARVYQAQNDKDRALLHIETLLKAAPEHERAAAMMLELKPPPQPVVAEPQPQPQPAPPAEEKPLTVEQLVARAERLRETDQPRKALALYEKADEMQPDDPDVKTGIGWCHVDLEESEAAVRSFNAALKLAPRLSDAHMGIAEAYRYKGDKAQALKHYKAYLDIMPSGSEAEVARRMIKMLGN